MAYTLSETSINKLKGIDSRLIKLVMRAIQTSPIDFIVLEGLRSQQRQIDLFKNGHSKCDGIKNKSNHQLGMAVDLAPYRLS